MLAFWQSLSLFQLLSCVRLCDPKDYSTSGFPFHHQLPELAQTHVHLVGDAIQPSHPLSPPCPPAVNLSQHQGLFQSVLRIRWPKFWSSSFSISPSNEYSGLISFRMDWLDLQNISSFPKGNHIPTKQFLPVSTSCKSLGTTNLWF